MNLCNAHLERADLFGADLREADLRGADLRQAHLSMANLRGAGLHLTLFIEANLSGANLHGAKIGRTTFGDVDLSTIWGLDAVIHQGPSTIGIDTLYRSQAHISEVFLRGAGVPDEFIAYAKSLVGRPFVYHSCFISYSSRDEALTQRLYTDLQAAGVRCWFAPEDLKIGDEFRSRIDQSIPIHDKLLLILSKHSLNSQWVQKEVEAAFEKERKEHRLMLFPIRIDNAILQSSAGWAADIRRMRHIGDFRQWKDHDAYQQAFARLLRDLKAVDSDSEDRVSRTGWNLIVAITEMPAWFRDREPA
jgi:TIR domain/Pentapeptide repeats (8 copies)